MDAVRPALTSLALESRESQPLPDLPCDPAAIAATCDVVRATTASVRDMARTATAAGTAVPADFEDVLSSMLRTLDSKEKYAVWNLGRLYEKAAEAGDELPTQGHPDARHALQALARRADYAVHHYRSLSHTLAHIVAMRDAMEDVLTMVRDVRHDAGVPPVLGNQAQ